MSGVGAASRGCDADVLQPSEGVAVLVLDPEHQSTKEQLAALLERLIDENYVVVVDATNAPLVDSSLMSYMLVASQIAAEKGKTFRLKAGTPQ